MQEKGAVYGNKTTVGPPRRVLPQRARLPSKHKNSVYRASFLCVLREHPFSPRERRADERPLLVCFLKRGNW